MIIMAHIKYGILLNYLEDRLSAEERRQVDAHLARPCWQCARHLTLLRAVLHTTTGDRTSAPPEEVLKRAVDIPKTHQTRQPKPWVRVVAALRFDSHLQLSAAATRGATRARQLLFTTEQLDIDLQIRPGRGDSDLLGQMLGIRRVEEMVPVFVSLQSSAGELLRATETDPLGQFAFRQIPFGTYDLVFDLENQEVAVTGLELKND
jgi:hypothetical protein